ncbi:MULTISPECIES: diaminobutyrate acetyltransferase [Vibrio]|uniref:L-2,4-diaminobutyric acid acetyltransferase n=1 Tax=Vibrio proteolyticus NBRC 13287 TaxID=1219065 RepID=U3BNJ6_VIBPR|nr:MULTISPECIES: diaminobutyrate acetyltransferase [Vibrio]NAW58961.1 diaminobutyrate acetyltransferase [Vibrio sp. V36_P2S2PM302]NAX20620.1 diaminobutyrate acetyltransferase [Vibrio sp. V39_P1S14PM300]NAX26608.1 diaminobutyrate acetyltransferase [Vibrio sp. V38_P2S17PM301]NAX30443.1 diaminobutyrate acetyltransferase [Vibrio sp. V37_P2S8PM304]GAD68153.1 L-2,4-diaminobutyric acid acetyltransferase [Vibrio proteolyticus NBRC 13287]
MWYTMITSAPWVMYPEIKTKEEPTWLFRMPDKHDGERVHQLIASCPPLDVNSAYCNFLQASHFRRTCVVAEKGGDIGGFVSGYLKPGNDKELFIWQVAVSPRYRGQGLALRMLNQLLERESVEQVEVIETTITEDNQSSWGLFKKLDRANGDQGKVTTFLDEDEHFAGKHDTEYLYRIPLTNS